MYDASFVFRYETEITSLDLDLRSLRNLHVRRTRARAVLRHLCYDAGGCAVRGRSAGLLQRSRDSANMLNCTRNHAAVLGGAVLTVGLVTGMLHISSMLPSSGGGATAHGYQRLAVAAGAPDAGSEQILQSLHQVNAQLGVLEAAQNDLVAQVRRTRRRFLARTWPPGNRGYSTRFRILLEEKFRASCNKSLVPETPTHYRMQ